MNDWTKQKRDRGGKWFVYPDDQSVTMIKALCSAFIDPEDLDDKLHVTLAFDKNNPLSAVRVRPATHMFHAEVVGTEMFGPNNDILVLLLNSPELQAEHERIHSDGAVFDFNPYQPHITIKYGARQSERDHLESIMVNPLRPQILVRFNKQARFMVEPKAD